eukprot:CAMPEP_0179868354 /NCGR_PEP_ID=MMETSP0982-20121206/18793_1 /TAXON_ID=483367 /ORGANISM="non described non described, Strain CCMP 2436" /LENGTH=204 /DNA_ID=CAMNT_0021758043 /DNA_START=92 /DNA_END=703 /DNA_ORIENTATION=-
MRIIFDRRYEIVQKRVDRAWWVAARARTCPAHELGAKQRLDRPHLPEADHQRLLHADRLLPERSRERDREICVLQSFRLGPSVERVLAANRYLDNQEQTLATRLPRRDDGEDVWPTHLGVYVTEVHAGQMLRQGDDGRVAPKRKGAELDAQPLVHERAYRVVPTPPDRVIIEASAEAKLCPAAVVGGSGGREDGVASRYASEGT